MTTDRRTTETADPLIRLAIAALTGFISGALVAAVSYNLHIPHVWPFCVVAFAVTALLSLSASRGKPRTNR